MLQKKDVVLVVDDTGVRNALKFLLEIVGLNVRPCANLAATLAIGAAGSCGCIILDGRMPAIDAVLLVQELRKRTLNIPVIMLNTELDRDSRARSMSAGVHRILDLPIVDRSLLEAVLSACESANGCPQHT
jgi:FixJ family two-component response regulator